MILVGTLPAGQKWNLLFVLPYIYTLESWEDVVILGRKVPAQEVDHTKKQCVPRQMKSTDKPWNKFNVKTQPRLINAARTAWWRICYVQIIYSTVPFNLHRNSFSSYRQQGNMQFQEGIVITLHVLSPSSPSCNPPSLCLAFYTPSFSRPNLHTHARLTLCSPPCVRIHTVFGAPRWKAWGSVEHKQWRLFKSVLQKFRR